MSTARELHRWNLCLHGGRILSQASYDAMIEPTATRSHRYGENGIIELSHSGYLPGFISTMLYYPQTQTSVIVLENVSWDIGDMARVFLVHDGIRAAVRQSSLVATG